MINKIWKLFSMVFMPLAVFLSPWALAEYTNNSNYYWGFMISWLLALVGIFVVASTQNMSNDEEIMEIEYQRLKSQESDKTTP
jgi:hypothetical protein